MSVVRLADKASEKGDNRSTLFSVCDTLSDALKAIDEQGLKPERCVICIQYEDGNGPDYWTANTTVVEALGLLEFAKHRILED